MSRLVMFNATELVRTVFSGLSALVIEDAGEVVCVRARTRGGAVACPGLRRGDRPRARVPRADGGGRARRRPPGLGPSAGPPDCAARSRAARGRRSASRSRASLDRYQPRTTRLTGQVGAVPHELAGRASARLLPALGMTASRHTALRVLLRIPLPALAVPRVLGDRRLRAAPRQRLRDRAHRRRDRPVRRRNPPQPVPR